MFAVSIYGSAWHVTNASIESTYRAFSKEKVAADIGVYIGLQHVNVTLQGEETQSVTPLKFS